MMTKNYNEVYCIECGKALNPIAAAMGYLGEDKDGNSVYMCMDCVKDNHKQAVKGEQDA